MVCGSGHVWSDGGFRISILLVLGEKLRIFKCRLSFLENLVCAGRRNGYLGQSLLPRKLSTKSYGWACFLRHWHLQWVRQKPG